MVKKSTKPTSSKELEESLCEVSILKENLNLLIKAIKNLQRVKELSVRQIFEISNKQVELDEEQVTLSKNLGAPGTATNHFEL